MQDEQTTLTVSLPESLRKEIENQAKREHRSVSNYVRLLLSEILAKKSRPA
ncbi:MAG: ribbon-helix-helix domain-containing protein [Terrimicrobiaceae bacterium]